MKCGFTGVTVYDGSIHSTRLKAFGYMFLKRVIIDSKQGNESCG